MRRQRPLDVKLRLRKSPPSCAQSTLAGQRVLITKFDHDPSRAVGSARHKRCSWPIGAWQEQWLRAYPQATAAQAATLAPRPPFNARVETVTTKPFFREPFTPKFRCPNIRKNFVGRLLDYSDCAENVSQAESSPELKPFMNHRLRCAEVPCVNASGTTYP